MRLRFLLPVLSFLFGSALAQVAEAQASSRSLAEFEGHYQYRDGGTLFMVASGERLIAIIGDAKYPLRATGPDTFQNGSGDSIPFVRDNARRIVAFQEKGATFRRLSSRVPAAARLLMEPRPRNSNGRNAAYRYAPPPKLPDRLVTGEAAPDMLPRDVAGGIVRSGLSLPAGSSSAPRARLCRILRRKRSSTGSVFREPPGDGTSHSIAASATSSDRSISGRATC